MDKRTVVFSALELLSVLCVARMWWRGEGSRLQKVLWTPFLLLPVVGVFVFFAAYDPPANQPESLQAEETRNDD
jgi:hypothetical protein